MIAFSYQRALMSSCLPDPHTRQTVTNPRWTTSCRRLRAIAGPVQANGSCPSFCVGGWAPSAVEIAAPASAVRLGPELALQLQQAPDPGAVGAEVGLEGGGRVTDGGQVDAEQLRASLQRRRDRPAQVWVVPRPTDPGYRTDVRKGIGNAA
jgi:hypothetical protein